MNIIIREVNNRLPIDIKFKMKDLEILPKTALIDTGCHSTSISLGQMLKFKELENLKLSSINSFMKNGYPKASISKGINDKEFKGNLKDLSKKELLNLKGLRFRQDIKDFKLGNHTLPIESIWVRYDYAPSLIGMDILKDLTWHYSNGIFILCNEDDSSKLYKLCKTLLFKSIIKEHKGIDESVESLPKEIDKDTAYRALYEVLQGTYFED